MIVPHAPFFWLVMRIVAFAVVSRVGNGAVLGMMVCVGVVIEGDIAHSELLGVAAVTAAMAGVFANVQ